LPDGGAYGVQIVYGECLHGAGALAEATDVPADPIMLTGEGTGQTASGTATDRADNTAPATVTGINIDKTAPVLGAPSWTTNPKPVGTTTAPVSTSLAVPAADALSGVQGGEYFVGNRPGGGHGSPMTYANGSLTATLGAGLGVGVYDIGVRGMNDKARSRFDAAHELGHLVMHGDQIWGLPEIEKQAHAFAAAFLVPEADIKKELPDTVDWQALFQLKQRWQVSLAALLMRAKTLGCMSPATYLTAVKAVSARGWRRVEPVPLGAPEQPQHLLSFINSPDSAPAAAHLPKHLVEAIATATATV